MKSVFMSSLICFLALSAAAAENIAALGKYGDLRLNNSRSFFWFHAGPKWSSNKRMNRTTLVVSNPGRTEKGTQSVSGRFVVSANDAFQFRSELRNVAEGEYLYEAQFRSEKPVPSTALFWMMEIPVSGGLFRAEVDEKSIAAPESYRTLALYESQKSAPVRKLVFQAGTGRVTLEGRFHVRIQDDRRFQKDQISLRIFPLESSSSISRCSMRLRIRLEGVKSVPLDLSRSANMGFADPVPDDERGGWTDQGPENDLSCMKPGVLDLGGIAFRILDPERNGGRSALVLSRYRRYPKTDALIPGDGKTHAYLYLLHACAWAPKFRSPVGEIRVTYEDGSRESIPVRTGIDVGNWWRPAMSCPNGLLLWKGTNFGGSVGLFVSAFRLKNAVVRQIRLVPGTEGVWMIVGASFANLRLEHPVERPFVIREGKEWRRIRSTGRVSKGSPLDFSRFLDSPAGKYGFVSIGAEGTFVLPGKKGERIRFLGTNLCQSLLFPSREEAELLAEQIAAKGYNSVRIHQFERGLMDRNANDTLTFDPRNLDRLQYLFAQLKKRGLYICTDLYATRPIRPGDGIAECASADGLERKVLNFISPTAMANWKEYVRRLLTTRNPYTGLTLLEDPALYSVNLDNEAPFPDLWAQYPKVISAVKRAYELWRKEKGWSGDSSSLPQGKEFAAFLAERQIRTQREQIRFLRELGAKFLITNLNNLTEKPSYQIFRRELDFIDAHLYHDHPSYPQGAWTTPTAYRQLSSLSLLGQTFYNPMSVRMFGRPFTVTEFQFCNPNLYRAENGLLGGALAGLQDWDGIYRFAYTHHLSSLNHPSISFGFDTIHDPIQTLAERVIWFLFLRGDAAAAKETIEFGIPESAPPTRFPVEFQRLGLFARIGSRPIPGSQVRFHCSDAAERAGKRCAASGRMRSSTGELELDSKQERVSFRSSRSEGVVLKSGAYAGTFLAVRDVDTFASLSVHSLDGLPLRESRSLLLFHLTNTANSGMKFRSADRKLLDSWGTLPLLARTGRAEVELRIPDGTVEALALDGSCLGRIPVRCSGGRLRFSARTNRYADDSVFCYHITRQARKTAESAKSAESVKSISAD